MTWINHDISSLLTCRVKTILKASDLLLEIKKMGKEEGTSTHVFFCCFFFPVFSDINHIIHLHKIWAHILLLTQWQAFIYPSSSQRINPCFTGHLLNQSMISSSPMSCSEKCWMNLQVEQWPGTSLSALFLLVAIPPSSSLAVKFLFLIFSLILTVEQYYWINILR